MSTGVHIEGHGVAGDPEAIAQYAQSVVDIMMSAFETHMEQSTVQTAIRGLVELAAGTPGVTGSTITNSTFSGLTDSAMHFNERDDEQ